VRNHTLWHIESSFLKNEIFILELTPQLQNVNNLLKLQLLLKKEVSRFEV